MINQDHNEALIIALEMAGVINGYGGFKKDKTGEKLGENEDNKLEYRTDGTDAFDTLVVGINKFGYENTFFVGMGVR